MNPTTAPTQTPEATRRKPLSQRIALAVWVCSQELMDLVQFLLVAAICFFGSYLVLRGGLQFKAANGTVGDGTAVFMATIGLCLLYGGCIIRQSLWTRR